MTTAQAARGGGAATTLVLSRPIADDKGKSFVEILLNEPSLANFMVAGRHKSAQEQTIALMAECAGVPASAIRRMKTRDANRARRWLEQIRNEPADMPDEDTADGRLFRLATPIVVNGQTIAELSLIEPDLDCGVAIEQVDGEHAQTAVMIAKLSGLTVPVVQHLRMRDIARIERWLYPLLVDSLSPEEDGAT